MPHDACCGHDHGRTFDGDDPGFRRALILVIALNAVMFLVEFLGGAIAGSLALQADSLDFAMDAATYGLSLAVIGMAPVVRARAALLKAATLGAIAAWVLAAAVWRVFVAGVPEPITMGAIAIAAFAANLASVLLLWRWREGDANVRSVWLCSRNDAWGNLLVVAAAAGVFGTRWPDLIVAAGMAGLFLNTSLGTARRALRELRAPQPGAISPRSIT
ncbi:cation transporter [Roseomonas alkaliterrae]|uniref:Co/Zn/Cd efflux system component n=1 Tax=Neoroseomonas alkaliterrae TaxID=1452450 RepID=A0A840XQB3_9PROT|nr:cation transporter [Neoroseomonas alkaliterrae]MBB5690106.1 Co/Zn/Cd efflux system component [Neoroseomonas alkaliterrae]MBR0676192.1 cation transporter [Neoroseomonas alkaliterrae]